MDSDSIRLLKQYQDGDSDAATQIFHRYVNRLIGLARSRISDGLARRVDAEDVVQSVSPSWSEVIAQQAGRSQRTVRRSLEDAEQRPRDRLLEFKMIPR